MGVKCTLFSGNAVLMKVVPVGGLIHGSDVKHRLRTRKPPAHPAPLHAILHQVPASPLDDAGCDRVARRQVFVITHAMGVFLEVAAHRGNLLKAVPLQTSLGCHLPQTRR